MADNNSNEIQILEAVSAAWEHAMVSNDAEAIGRFMADDWVIVSERGATNKADFLAVVASGDLTHETEITSVRQYGEAAVLTGRVRNNGHYKGRPFSSTSGRPTCLSNATANGCAFTAILQRQALLWIHPQAEI